MMESRLKFFMNKVVCLTHYVPALTVANEDMTTSRFFKHWEWNFASKRPFIFIKAILSPEKNPFFNVLSKNFWAYIQWSKRWKNTNL